MKKPGPNLGRRINDGKMGTVLKSRSGEVAIGVLALIVFLGAAVSDGIKNDIEYRNQEREEVVIYGND